MLSNSTKYSTLRNLSLFQFSRLTNNETKIKKYILLYIYILYIIKNVLLNAIDKIEWIVFTNCINFTNFDNNMFLITLLSIKTNNKLHSSHSLISIPIPYFTYASQSNSLCTIHTKEKRKNQKKIISNYFSTTNSNKRRNRVHDWKVRPKPITLSQTSRPINNRRPRIFLTQKQTGNRFQPSPLLPLSCPTRGSLPHPLWSLLLIPSRTHHSSNDCSLNWFLIYHHEANVARHRGMYREFCRNSHRVSSPSDTRTRPIKRHLPDMGDKRRQWWIIRIDRRGREKSMR